MYKYALPLEFGRRFLQDSYCGNNNLQILGASNWQEQTPYMNSSGQNPTDNYQAAIGVIEKWIFGAYAMA